MKIIANILIAIGILAILFIVFLIAGFCLYSMTPDIKSQINVSGSAEALKSFNDKIEDFKKEVEEAVTNKEKKELSLRLTEQEINSKIIEKVAEGEIPFKELSISLKDNLCWVYLENADSFVTTKIGMILKLQIEKGNIKIGVNELHVGKLPLPKSIDNNAADLLNVIINMQNPLRDLPVELKSISIGNNQLIFKVITRPEG